MQTVCFANQRPVLILQYYTSTCPIKMHSLCHVSVKFITKSRGVPTEGIWRVSRAKSSKKSGKMTERFTRAQISVGQYCEGWERKLQNIPGCCISEQADTA